MSQTEPRTDQQPEFGDPDAPATSWADGQRRLEQAELYWITTVRPDGRPHVTPLIGVWVDGRWCFCTGATERKARNLEQNRQCAVTTGDNALHGGLDVVLEGVAERVEDRASLARLADAYVAKYGEDWRFAVGDGVFTHEAGEALVFAVAPTTVFGFGKDPYSQTRWTF